MEIQMDFLELAKNRYSERKFSDQPIEKEKMDRILEAGRIVPTACNYQPQRFIVLESDQALNTIRSITPFTYNAPAAILVCYDLDTVWKNPADSWYENYNSGEQDATIAATTMMYEAEEQGIHSIWARGFDSKTVADAFNLPPNLIPVMILGLGYPSGQSKAHPWHFKRMPIEEMAVEI